MRVCGTVGAPQTRLVAVAMGVASASGRAGRRAPAGKCSTAAASSGMTHSQRADGCMEHSQPACTVSREQCCVWALCEQASLHVERSISPLLGTGRLWRVELPLTLATGQAEREAASAEDAGCAEERGTRVCVFAAPAPAAVDEGVGVLAAGSLVVELDSLGAFIRHSTGSVGRSTHTQHSTGEAAVRRRTAHCSRCAACAVYDHQMERVREWRRWRASNDAVQPAAGERESRLRLREICFSPVGG